MKRLKIEIDDVVLAREDFTRDINDYYLDLQTGEVVSVDNMLLSSVEEGEVPDNLPDWQKHEIPIARAIAAEDERYVYIPANDADESYRLMRDFVLYEVEDEEAAAKLEVAISGPGAFRRFKDVLMTYPEIEKKWFDYRGAKQRECTLEWLGEIGIEPIE